MSIRIALLFVTAFSIALLLGGCGDRQEEARNTPAELTAAAVEAHVKTMVEGLGDVRIVETSPGHFTGTGSHDGRVYQFVAVRDGWMTRYELESEGAEGRKTIQETVWSDGSSTGTERRETLLKTPDGRMEISFPSSSTVRGEPAYRATPAYQELLRTMEDLDRKMEEMKKKNEAEKKAQEQKLDENP